MSTTIATVSVAGAGIVELNFAPGLAELAPGDYELVVRPAAQPVAEGYEELARPTDLSKRLRGLYERDTSRRTFLRAADEIDRYYGGMVAWKQAAEAKDAISAQLAERVAVLEAALNEDAAEARSMVDKLCDEMLATPPQPHADEAAKGGWISVEERLPELSDNSVLALFPHGGVDIVHIQDYFAEITNGSDEDGNQLYSRWYISQGVTHWQPLPAPPSPAEDKQT